MTIHSTQPAKRTRSRAAVWWACIACLGLLVHCDQSLSGDEALQGPAPPEPASPGAPPRADEPAGETVEPHPYLPPAFDVYGIEPSTGLITGGDDVVITGVGFQAGMIVLLGELVVDDLFIVSETMAIFETPAHPPGLVDVLIRHLDIEDGAPRILEGAFVYYAEVDISEIVPPEGVVTGGEPITVHGAGFSEGAEVYIDGRKCLSQVRVDAYTLTALTPPGAHGVVDVHVVSDGPTASLVSGFTYRTAPRILSLSPHGGAPEGGETVRLLGEGLTAHSLVHFGDQAASVLAAPNSGAWLDVTSPSGAPGLTVDVEVANDWGADALVEGWHWADPSIDPYILACHLMQPTGGPSAGGTLVTLLCDGLHYGVTVTFGEQEVTPAIVNAEAGLLQVVSPSGPPGEVALGVASPFDEVVAGVFTWAPLPSLTLHEVTPASGPDSGGSLLSLSGAGFGDGAAVLVGALPATGLVVLNETSLSVTAPAGSPGTADVRVFMGGEVAVLPDGFTYTGGGLGLDLLMPTSAAQSGGTLVRVIGHGFTPEAQVRIGGVDCEIVEQVSGAEILIRSPALPASSHDVEITQPSGSVLYPSAFHTYDAQTGYSGTWGGDIHGAVDVTVLGSNSYGPIPAATVVLETSSGDTMLGLTDALGQVTLSALDLEGPIQLTVTHPDFASYSLIHFDAPHVTLYLKRLEPTPGKPESEPEHEMPILRGKVTGLGKYVVAPPGDCGDAQDGTTADCTPCDDEGLCAAGYLCVDLALQGPHCLADCAADGQCSEGYVCAGSEVGAVCTPTPGVKEARCTITSTKIYQSGLTIPDGGVVDDEGYFAFTAARLGEMAIVCVGGYVSAGGDFTPTVMGLRRHLSITPGPLVDDLDVTLDHPLKRTIRLRLLDPPVWPADLNPPYVRISLDLGPDGYVPMSRDYVPDGPQRWLAPQQPATLTGTLYDARYSFYSWLTTGTTYPRSYNLITGVTKVTEDRIPMRMAEGWELTSAGVHADLYGAWAADGQGVMAVGDAGVILRFDGTQWTPQPTAVDTPLRDIGGRSATDLWVVGDAGVVLHWDGLGWQPYEGLAGDLVAVSTAPEAPVYVVGPIRLWRMGADGTFSVEGPPWLQGLSDVHAGADGSVVACGHSGRAFHRGPAGAWVALQTDTESDLHGIIMDPVGGAILAVGAGGAILEGSVSDGLATVPHALTDYDLHSATRGPQGAFYVVGDGGTILHRAVDGLWTREEVPDYHAEAFDVVAPADGSPPLAVGAVDFILGPYVHYPIMNPPSLPPGGGSLSLSWTADTGPATQYSQVRVLNDGMKTLWTMIVDGPVHAVALPDLGLLAGFETLGSGERRLEVTRVLNRNFDIDGYTSREFEAIKRDSWAIERADTYFSP